MRKADAQWGRLLIPILALSDGAIVACAGSGTMPGGLDARAETSAANEEDGDAGTEAGASDATVEATMPSETHDDASSGHVRTEDTGAGDANASDTGAGNPDASDANGDADAALDAASNARDAAADAADAQVADATGPPDCTLGDGDPCSVCDKAECCCYAAVGQSYCNAYSGAGCRAADDAGQTYLISQCGIEVGAAVATNACR